MTYQEFREEYPSFRDLYIYCMDNGLEQMLLDWLDDDYRNDSMSENLHLSMYDFLHHFTIIDPKNNLCSSNI